MGMQDENVSCELKIACHADTYEINTGYKSQKQLLWTSSQMLMYTLTYWVWQIGQIDKDENYLYYLAIFTNSRMPTP